MREHAPTYPRLIAELAAKLPRRGGPACAYVHRGAVPTLRAEAEAAGLVVLDVEELDGAVAACVPPGTVRMSFDVAPEPDEPEADECAACGEPSAWLDVHDRCPRCTDDPSRRDYR